MTTIQEICSLTEGERDARRKALSRGLLSQVRERRLLSDGLALRFDATPVIRAELDEFIAFERGCCPTLGLSVHASADALELAITGLDSDVQLFMGAGPGMELATPGPSRWRRILSAAGLGTLGALTLCCVLPVAGVALFGTALAAPFANLDDPWVISSTALALAGGVWRWRQQRDAQKRAVSVPAACATDGECGC